MISFRNKDTFTGISRCKKGTLYAIVPLRVYGYTVDTIQVLFDHVEFYKSNQEGWEYVTNVYNFSPIVDRIIVKGEADD